MKKEFCHECKSKNIEQIRYREIERAHNLIFISYNLLENELPSKELNKKIFEYLGEAYELIEKVYEVEIDEELEKKNVCKRCEQYQLLNKDLLCEDCFYELRI